MTAADFEHAELTTRGITGPYFVSQHRFEATTATQADAQSIVTIQDSIDADGRRAFATGNISADLLFGERQTGRPCPDGLQGFFAGNLL